VKFGHALLENIIENLNTAIAGNIWREHGQNASTLFFFLLSVTYLYNCADEQ
jgi:hypothetical protein